MISGLLLVLQLLVYAVLLVASYIFLALFDIARMFTRTETPTGRDVLIAVGVVVCFLGLLVVFW